MLPRVSFLFLLLLALLSMVGVSLQAIQINAEAAASKTQPTTDTKSARDPEKDALKSYEELTRLLVALATGALVLAPTVLGASKGSKVAKRWAFTGAVMLLVASMVAGITGLSALAGAQHEGEYDISAPLVRYSGLAQWLTFGSGLLMFCIFSLANLGSHPESER